ncbi:MAG: hypothetical protein R6U86_03725 [Bacteroidales bacterium]
MSFKTCLFPGGKALLTPTMEKIIFLSSLIGHPIMFNRSFSRLAFAEPFQTKQAMD